MGKGELTRRTILDHATGLASRVGLEGVTIGQLAEDLGLSKSGLFSHFKSKEALQIQILDHAANVFVEHVVRPALTAPRGEPRVRALFERWLDWARSSPLPGGCIFVAAASEMDDRPGPVREHLVKTQRAWLDALATAFRLGIEEGHFRKDAEPAQFAHDAYAIALGHHHAYRLMRDPEAERRGRAAFETLLTGLRADKRAPRRPARSASATRSAQPRLRS